MWCASKDADLAIGCLQINNEAGTGRLTRAEWFCMAIVQVGISEKTGWEVVMTGHLAATTRLATLFSSNDRFSFQFSPLIGKNI